jgi:hypothetical protein
VRSLLDSLFALASGEPAGSQPPGPPGPGPALQPPPQPAGPPIRISLIGADDLKYAARDLCEELDRLASAVGRKRGRDGAANEAVERLSELRSQAEAVSRQEGRAVKEAARQLGGLISSIDSAISQMRSYAELRPQWVAARGLAMGIYNFAR